MGKQERKGEMLPKLEQGKPRGLPCELMQQMLPRFDAALLYQQARPC